MAQVTGISRRREPTILLLGLLALLLWGQCASQLFPGTAHEPPTFRGWVKSLDSLRTTPATLYLTLSLRNDLSQPVQVRKVSGTLLYGSRAHPFSATAALRDTLVYPWTALTHSVAIPLHLAPDSLALLRTLLQTGYLATTSPRLRWQASYSLQQAPGTLHQVNVVPYLPLLKPRQPAPRRK